MRSGFKPCKSCRSLHLRSQYRAQFAAPAPPPLPHPPAPPPHAKNASFRSDPYEYMRKARIGSGGGANGRNGDSNNVDDWQSCWVDEAEDARNAIQQIFCIWATLEMAHP